MQMTRTSGYLLVMTVIVSLCVGCGRERAAAAAGEGPAPGSADVKATAEEQPPFPVSDEPPPTSVPRVAMVWSGDLWIANVETGEAFQVTDSSDCLYQWGPPPGRQSAWWSPDGKQIAYVRKVREEVEDQRLSCPYYCVGTVWLADAESGESRQLSDLEQVGQLAWSPNGKVLVASGAHRFNDVSRLTNARELEQVLAGDWDLAAYDAGVWLISALDGTVQLIAHQYTGLGDILDVVWGPEALALVNECPSSDHSSPTGLGAEYVDVVRLSGAHLADLREVWPLVWNTTRARGLYFGQQADPEHDVLPGDGIHYLDLDERPPKSEPLALSGMTVYRLALSPDGANLACWAEDRQKVRSLWIVETATKKARRLAGVGPPLSWCPTDNRILACSGPGTEDVQAAGVICLVDAKTGEKQRLWEVQDGVAGLTWSRDGRLLAYETQTGWEELSPEQYRPVLGLWVVDTHGGEPRQVIQAHQCCGWAM